MLSGHVFPELIILKEWSRSTQPTVQKIIAKVLRGLLSSTHVPQLFQSEHYVACLRSHPTTRLRSFENDDIRELYVYWSSPGTRGPSSRLIQNQ